MCVWLHFWKFLIVPHDKWTLNIWEEKKTLIFKHSAYLRTTVQLGWNIWWYQYSSNFLRTAPNNSDTHALRSSVKKVWHPWTTALQVLIYFGLWKAYYYTQTIIITRSPILLWTRPAIWPGKFGNLKSKVKVFLMDW